jgi:hypothetical protein
MTGVLAARGGRACAARAEGTLVKKGARLVDAVLDIRTTTRPGCEAETAEVARHGDEVIPYLAERLTYRLG